MRQTAISYMVTFDDQINVLEINNALTRLELYAILGAEKLREYSAKGGWKASNYREGGIDEVKNDYPILEPNKVYTKDEFEKKIARLKKAGELFVALKNQVKEVKTILI